MKRDFCAIMMIGRALIAKSNNPQSEAAVRKLIYGLATFVTEDQIESVVAISDMLDFETSAAALSTLGDEEYKWAKELLYAVATTDGDMNAAQTALWNRL